MACPIAAVAQLLCRDAVLGGSAVVQVGDLRFAVVPSEFTQASESVWDDEGAPFMVAVHRQARPQDCELNTTCGYILCYC
jgi:hypothetical protein